MAEPGLVDALYAGISFRLLRSSIQIVFIIRLVASTGFHFAGKRPNRLLDAAELTIRT